ncbi:excalibur calcium-binding domain-containing protein [Sediminihabitans luteus]|uniref:Excalibur calcium-binding domain-containing protein n=1 Tax=Sediminihabitans luteus TaxID=1138585 RepID=A0A2M9CC01_9CELL|nr:DUF1524 domain-containing protein [Sediminihabitans luteus]PJJ68581.1 excalibur calcium-binding domain-containing protein [Sediminihabitans luteus]GII99919.1 hypothetical protein Slu03_22970 [Sediminihabitans luteus]
MPLPSKPLTRRVTFWLGLGGLVLFVIAGLGADGAAGALAFGGLFVAVCALWGILTTRPWWGRTSRRGATVVGGLALVALVVGGSLGAGVTDDVPAAASSTPAASSAGTARPTATGTASPSAAPTPSAEATASSGATGGSATGTAAAALAELDVKGRAPKTGYDRDAYGPAWADTDHNGCDTRNDILARDLTDETFKSGTHDCVVLTGTLVDPYGGETIHFQRGQDTSTAVQIDHVVALSDSWQKGAQRWDAATRKEFANDPLNLLASDGPLNMSKGDGDAATWLPPNKAFRCDYVARQVAVKHAYGLWVTQAEHDAIADVLATCPGEPLPDEEAATTPVVVAGASSGGSSGESSSSGGGDDASSGTKPATTPKPAPKPTTKPAPKPEPEPADVYYENCTAVRAAGADPIRVGDPGYSTKLDRDGDGVGCE